MLGNILNTKAFAWNILIAATTFVLLVTFSSLSRADSSSINPIQKTDSSQSLVWKITGPEVSEPSYLAGTIHVICNKDFTLDQRFVDGINNTEQLVGEIDMDDKAEKQIMHKAMFSDVSLKERMSKPQYQQFEELFNDITGMKLDKFDYMSVFSLMRLMTISQFQCAQRTSIEKEILQLAKKNNKEVLGLEKVADQLRAFEKMTPQYGDLLSSKQVALYKKGAEQTQKLLDLYFSEDTEELFNYTSHSFDDMGVDKEVKRELLDKRNKSWAKKIPSIIAKKPTFIAVGAGHLGGKQGVIQLLRDRGLTLTPVAK
ncbi:TraB/GumN family protein [Pleionea sp. CnH1-48]|uniref:TraB/GumN family protein n=1 Tax=Pleionea sp. CnH1-48 TaxID=2954494 RepID=UPI002096B6E9|nr:TraB/GumN family protein [Pleionea sp. CnH1-48]MCO7222855.1 TraB/GumN family protein [Pleionea sp. CnH1-48]